MSCQHVKPRCSKEQAICFQEATCLQVTNRGKYQQLTTQLFCIAEFPSLLELFLLLEKELAQDERQNPCSCALPWMQKECSHQRWVAWNKWLGWKLNMFDCVWPLREVCKRRNPWSSVFTRVERLQRLEAVQVQQHGAWYRLQMPRQGLRAQNRTRPALSFLQKHGGQVKGHRWIWMNRAQRSDLRCYQWIMWSQ